MELLSVLGFSLILASLTQIQHTQAQDCSITSITSPSASSLKVKWNQYSGATNYFLDLRVVNSTTIAPVVVTVTASTSEKVVQGLRPGTVYSVTVKVFQFYYVICLDSEETITVPATSQITFSRAISSTAIRFEWSSVRSAETYFLIVQSTATANLFNHSFANLSGEVHNLQPSTSYNCYVYSSNAAGQGSSSRMRTVTTLVEPPGGVNATHTSRSTARLTWEPVNKVLLYAVTVADTDNPSSAPFVTNTSSTYVDIRNLQPCSTYRIGVSSVNAFLVPGESTYVYYTTKTINAVTSISADYSCSSGMVTVSWGMVFGAESYRATATDGNGTTLSCTTQSDSCPITRVACGERYLVHVTAISEGCESTSNITSTFETVPCPPINLLTYRECSSNLIVVSWDPTNNTNYYVATALATTGEVTECRTTDLSCFFTNTGCGEGYQYTVYSVSGLCNSPISPAVHVRTAPCDPTNVKTLAGCQSDVLTTTWDRSDGALSYIVEAHGNRGDQYNCTSFGNSCAMPAVRCGESLSVWITAMDDDCSSGRALGEAAETAPCTPQNVTAISGCGSDHASLDWEGSAGAVFYIGSAVHADGTVRTCIATDSECQIQGLRCGQTYTASVIATNFKCNSSESARVTLETAPCPPDHIEAFLDCEANHALIVWQNHQSVGSYAAVIEDEAGNLLSCNTLSNNCKVQELTCGQQYSVTVTRNDGTCHSLPSVPIRMDSVPCAPENVWTNVSCGTGELTVGWDVSVPGQNYTTTVSTGTGERTMCNSTDMRCSLSNLKCGTSYMVVVMSVNGTCLSKPSRDVLIQEVPCAPTNVTVERTCGQSTVAVRWAASLGAVRYTAVAVGNGGHRARCSSNGTACDLADLLCGEVYTVGVVAEDDNCTSLQSQTTTLETVPCAPASLRGWVDCASHAAFVSWAPSPNAASYAVTATSADGHSHSCNSTSPACQVTSLRCGKEYAFTVKASDGSCDSPHSAPFRQETAPCAPTNVSKQLYCGTDTLSVSWDPSAMPLNYSATARAPDGSALFCTSGGSGCQVAGLLCGRRYSIAVAASNANCSSPESAALSVQTVPCSPLNVRGSLQCGTDTLLASWDGAPGASAYVAMVTGADSYLESCDTTNLSCSFSGLRCAQSYAISVVASDDDCNSTASPAVSLVTAPCDPENVAIVLHCGSDTATARWDASTGANGYTVVAQGRAGRATCRTVGTSCRLDQLACGDTYNLTVLAEDGVCNSTWKTSTVLQTAPCPPQMVQSSLDCGTNVASLSWTAGSNALEVTVNATTTLGHTDWCSSTNATCQLTNLQCGHTYAVVAQAMGDQCDSGPSSGADIVTVPCAPPVVSTRYDCGTHIATVTWDDSLGRESFVASVEGGDHVDSCSTDQTSCFFTQLQCGHAYNASVRSLATHCNSSLSLAYGLRTVPCEPQNVSASLVCANNTALVTWDGSEGAVAYNATALGRDGDAMSCHTPNTSCHLPGMHCGQTYNITVTAYSETCGGFHSNGFTYTAGPCPPSNVAVALECGGHVGSVSWSPALGAEMYWATATGADGLAHTCNSSSTGCSFTDLQCGETYSVTVVTVEMGCLSEPSVAVDLKSAICPPSNLNGVMSCANNTLSLSWDVSPGVGVSYFLYSWKLGGANTTAAVTGTSHSISGLQCGESYSFWVSAWDATCNSSLSNALRMDAPPCPPTNLAVRVDCGSNRGTISWQPSVGTGLVSYMAEVTGVHGHRAFCTSNSTSCWVKLDCGQQYSATVISFTDACNSTLDSIIEFDSAPCLPEDVMADLDCDANVLAVQWRESPGSDSYTALAIGNDGYRASCNSTSTACAIHDLQCGQTYNITVTTSSVNCSFIQGSDYQVQSAPCRPQDPAVSLNCSSNEVAVSWAGSGAAQMHSVTAVDRYDVTVYCNSSDDGCTFSDLSCGETYTFSIAGMTNQCRSDVSPSMELLTAPCAPTHVTASYDCDTGIAMIMWDAARGATNYTVWAEGSRGHTASCSNWDTLCTLDDLACGQDYHIVVVAARGSCATFASEPAAITTGPCPHSQLRSSLDCSSNDALISWTPGNGTLSYNASAEALSAGHHMSCVSNGSACNISALQCGLRYRISVEGMSLTCPSRPGTWIPMETAPCAPTQLSVLSSCDSDTASVSWAAAEGAVAYVVMAEAGDGHRRTCNSSGVACDIDGLECGREYAVSVTGVDGDCIGARSEIQTLTTAPCVPDALETRLECQAGDLSVAWQPSRGADLYRVVAENWAGEVLAFDTHNTTHVFPGLPCSETYNVTVAACGDTCNSSASLGGLVHTAPCPPPAVEVTVDCPSEGNLTIKISIKIIIRLRSWAPPNQGPLYRATAVNALGLNSTCTVTDSTCDIEGLQCGTEYNVTITSSMDGCAGPPSVMYTVMTAPCVPRLVEVEMDCLADSASLMWAESEGVGLYSVTAEDGLGGVKRCESEGMGCRVTGLQCGQGYDFSLTTSDSYCNSSQSNVLHSMTAPCPPQDIQVNMSCENQTGSISWAHSQGALRYFATLHETNGTTSTCTSTGTTCDFSGLPCGEAYTVTVMAEGRTCNSTPSHASSIFKTAPCMPQNLRSSTSCVDGVAAMAWSRSQGALLYTVEATSSDGNTTSCTSAGDGCDLTGLRCGRSYTVTASAAHATCSSVHTQPITVTTVPCPPEDVLTELDCESNTMTVYWSESDGAEYYTATLVDGNRHSTSCQSTGAKCNITALRCGETYHVTVAASDSLCPSPSSANIDMPTAPCLPSNIEAHLDCQDQTAIVSWFYSTGALSYTVMAQTQTGNNVTCDTNNTNCILSDLACGELYSVSVQAQGETCNSTAKMAGQLMTEPCVPQNLDVQYSLSIGQLFWDHTKGATWYTGEGITDQGLSVTCNTTDTNCVLNGIACGQVYNITITAHNEACRDTVTSDIFSLTTEPCPPENVQARVECESGDGVVSWEQSLVALGYVAFLEGRNGDSANCRTAETFCSMPGLDCGIIYYVRVQALGLVFNSSNSASVSLTTAPCAPNSIGAQVDCVEDMAMISWTFSNGAESYNATVEAAGGHQASCTTEENYCNVTGLSCGETYNLTLTSTNQHCQIHSTTEVTFHTRPCTPTRLGVNLQCGSRTASLTWEHQDEAEHYTASAVSSAGVHAEDCNSTGPTCLFPSLDCGETYSFTVTAHAGQCHSEVSDPVMISTEPCRPERVIVQETCTSEAMVLDWDEAEGALVYFVSVVGNLGYVTAFNTTENTLEEELPCGQTYSISVVAQDDRCDSPPADPAEFRTAPCVPQHLQTYNRCEPTLGSVSWAESDGADSYMAVAEGQNSHTHMCTTNGTDCTWNDLYCGEVYTIHVVAQDNECTSSPSGTAVIHTAPCVPQHLVPSFDCGLKVASLTWDASEGAELYVVAAEDGDGHRMELSTNDTQAHFSEFTCGQVYSLDVTAISQECRSGQSMPVLLQTEPCAPTGVTTALDCVSNIATMTWVASNGSEYYTATVQTAAGESQACMSSSTQCGLSSLNCGQTYSVFITASNQQCNSTTSAAATNLFTVPCAPSNLAVDLDCAGNIATLSWNRSQGALSYSAKAESSRGSPSFCVSDDPHCTFANLTCGAPYSMYVLAVGEQCSSLKGESIEFNTAPCPPQNVEAQMSCDSGTLVVTWDPNPGADSFHVEANTDDGAELSCESNGTQCSFSSLPCGHTYSVTVSAIKEGCHGEPSQAVLVSSAPCVPQGIMGNLDCVTNSVWVMWAPSLGAQNYSVVAQGVGGYNSSCSSSEPSCNVPDLSCGVLYTFNVTASNSHCQSQPNTTFEIETAPCVLSTISAVTQCRSSTIQVLWELIEGSPLYIAMAEGNDRSTLSCNSTTSSCNLTGALCGMHYTIIVAASSDKCSSLRSPPFKISTAPCTLEDVVAQANCESQGVSVSWAPSPVAESYRLTATGSNGDVQECNTATTNCTLEELQCGQPYSLSVIASSGNCTSSASLEVTFNSVPCMPSSLSVEVECGNSSAVLAWTESEGSLEYFACAQGENGDMLYCDSMDTSCTIEGLECGAMYNFSVQASDGICNGSFSEPLMDGAAPCPPDMVQTRLLPMSAEAQAMRVSWSQVDCPNVMFLVEATGSIQGNQQQLFELSSYWVDHTFFEILLPCSSSYSVTVKARNLAGTGQPSVAVTGTTAPCPPMAVTFRENNMSAVLSWNASVFATDYTVYELSTTGRTELCNTAQLSCTLVNVNMSLVEVTASNSAGESNPTRDIQDSVLHRNRRDVPDIPVTAAGLSAPQVWVTALNASSLRVEWTKVTEATFYTVTVQVQSSTGPLSPLVLTTTGEESTVTNLTFATEYCIVVTAENSLDGSSPPSQPACAVTGGQLSS